jgi:ubiquinone/menaquinone biosynthesis C-methylase UbiE
MVAALYSAAHPAHAPIDVADIACGGGVLTHYAATHTSVRSVLASDFSSGMCAVIDAKVAKEASTAAAYRAPIRTLVADAQNLSAIPDASVDITFCVFAVMMIPDPELAVREMARITKAGGLVCMINWSETRLSQMHALMVSMHKHLAATAPAPAGAAAPTVAPSGDAPNVVASVLERLPLNTIESSRAMFDRVNLETIAVETHTENGPTYAGAKAFIECT